MRFVSYKSDVVRLVNDRITATFYAVRGYVDIPDGACLVYAEDLAAKMARGELVEYRPKVKEAR